MKRKREKPSPTRATRDSGELAQPRRVLGKVIAERRIPIRSPRGGKIIVRVGTPRVFEQDAVCPVKISTPEDPGRVEFVWGIDEMQTLALIGPYCRRALAGLRPRVGPKDQYLLDGFPILVPEWLPGLTGKVESLIERELQKSNRQFDREIEKRQRARAEKSRPARSSAARSTKVASKRRR